VSAPERGWWLGDGRWPVAGAIALVAAGISAVGGRWLEAVLFFAAALALAVVTLRTARR
jgi:hypothetical protein